MRFRILAVSVLSSALVSCGGSTEPTAPQIDCSTLATTLTAEASTLTTTASGLKYRDVTVGTGATYANGTTVSVRYAGCLTNGSRFDSNEPPKNVISFRIGAGVVIKGWDEGLVGMKVGGRRQLVIPPSLGYGSASNGSIPANSTLVFTVDAISTP